MDAAKREVTSWLLLCGIVFFVGSLIAGYRDLWNLVVHNDPLPTDANATVLLAFAAVVLGILLFVLYQLNQRAYGLSEIFLSLVIVVRLVFHSFQSEPTAAVLAFVGAAYLITNGMNNILSARGAVDTVSPSAKCRQNESAK